LSALYCLLFTQHEGDDHFLVKNTSQ